MLILLLADLVVILLGLLPQCAYCLICFRIYRSVEFEDVHRLGDGQSKHSPEAFYAGSLWKVKTRKLLIPSYVHNFEVIFFVLDMTFPSLTSSS
jgi:hypothetical protein